MSHIIAPASNRFQPKVLCVVAKTAQLIMYFVRILSCGNATIQLPAFAAHLHNLCSQNPSKKLTHKQMLNLNSKYHMHMHSALFLLLFAVPTYLFDGFACSAATPCNFQAVSALNPPQPFKIHGRHLLETKKQFETQK